MERFVRRVVAGGVALVVGLWLLALFGGRPLPRVAGLALAVAGVAGLADGIRRELNY